MMKPIGYLFGVLFCWSGSAFAVPVSQCGTTISQPGTYDLTQNLSCGTVSPAIRIQATQGVILNLNSRSISGDLRRGVGILIEKSKKVVVNGPGKVGRLRTGVSIRGSYGVRVIGDRLSFSDSGVGIESTSSRQVELLGLDFRNNRQVDVILSATEEVFLRKSLFDGRTPVGMLMRGAIHTEISHSRFGVTNPMKQGVVLSQGTQKTYIVEDSFDRAADVAILMTGAGTLSALVKDVSFGQLSPNGCDLRVENQAGNPQIIAAAPSICQ